MGQKYAKFGRKSYSKPLFYGKSLGKFPLWAKLSKTAPGVLWNFEFKKMVTLVFPL
jgi:hypothetical protein